MIRSKKGDRTNKITRGAGEGWEAGQGCHRQFPAVAKNKDKVVYD